MWLVKPTDSNSKSNFNQSKVFLFGLSFSNSNWFLSRVIHEKGFIEDKINIFIRFMTGSIETTIDFNTINQLNRSFDFASTFCLVFS